MCKKHCALCGALLTKQADSKEHIIPNAIGGRKTVKGFICKTCNSEKGASWDTELAKQLAHLSLFFNISRQRGNVQPQVYQTISGEEILLRPDNSMTLARPEYSETILDTGEVKLSFKARTNEEARKILTGVKRKYPTTNIDIDSLANQITTHYRPDPLHIPMTFGGLEAGRSIVKSALALAADVGIAHESCNTALEYLRDSGAPCFGYYYEKDPILNRPTGTPLHCVYIKGDPVSGQIIGYVEYFGTWRLVLCLADSYAGDKVDHLYAIDPRNNTHLNLKIDISLTPDDIQAAYNYKKMSTESVKSALEEVISPRIKEIHNTEMKREISDAVKYAFENCGIPEGHIIEHEGMKKVISLFWDKFQPFLHSRLVQPRRDDENVGGQ